MFYEIPLLYFSISFCTLHFNPLTWPTKVRVLATMLDILISFFAAIIILTEFFY